MSVTGLKLRSIAMFHMAGLLLGLPLVVMAAPGKPIAMVAGGEQYDVQRFTKRVLAPSGYIWENCGRFLEPEEFNNYSLVIWFSGSPTNFNEHQTAVLKEYLTAGGRVLHTGGGLFARALGRGKLKAESWAGALAWHYNSSTNRPFYPFLQPDHPYLQGVDTQHQHIWQRGHYLTKPASEGTVNLLGDEQTSLFSVTRVGEGEMVWLWEGPFRTRNHELPADGDAFDVVLRNIITAATPLTAAEELRRKAAALTADPTALLCWQRDWDDTFQDDYLFVKPYPASADYIDRLEFNSALNERDTHFMLCQSLTSQQVKTALTPLRRESDGATFQGALRLFVSDQPPVVPSLVRKENSDFPERLGRFMLTPVSEGFKINDWRPRVLWLELATHKLTPGDYRATLQLTGETMQREIALQVKVYPVRMPRKRISELRYWGGSIPMRQPFLRELERQGCHQMSLNYPSLDAIRLRTTGQSLTEALRKNREVFAADTFPELDFRGAYETNLLWALEHYLSNVRVQDVRTGATLAAAGSGVKLGDMSALEWPEEAQRIYTAYYGALYRYLQEKGFKDVSQIWTDEPGWGTITNTYLARARLHMAGGMGSGTHWTASGFMSAAEVNRFAPYTTDWSVYTIILPNFLRFLRAGELQLAPRSYVGMTRGGCGYALRLPPNRSRTLAWTMVYYGEPVNYVRTGPIWKEWLYYVNFDRGAPSRPDGIEGERLLAYGCSDPKRGEVDILSSSDWEGSRDGVDDVNLVRMLEWYLDRLEEGSRFNLKGRRLAREIRADMATWFRDAAQVEETRGFEGGRLVDADDGENSGGGESAEPFFVVRQQRYGHGDNRYHYQGLQPPATATIEALKRRVLEHLVALQPHLGKVAGSLMWHEWQLVRGGRAQATLLLPENPSLAVEAAAIRLLDTCEELSGCRLERAVSGRWRRPDPNQIILLAGTPADPAIGTWLKEAERSVDATYPGSGNYLILRDEGRNLLLIVGADDEGVVLGLKNFAVFLDGRGNWLQVGK